MRVLTIPLALALLVGLAPRPARAGDDGLTGSWKVTIFEGGQQVAFWILSFESKDGQPTGRAQPLKDVPPTAVENLKVTGDTVQFALKVKNGPTFDYEGKLPRPGAKKAFGSISRQGSMIPVTLEATTAKDAFELNREIVTRTPNDPRAFTALFDLLGQAKGQKLPAAEVQEIIERSLKAAEVYGPRWQLHHSLKLVEALRRDPAYAPVAVEAARRAEALLDPKAPADTQLRLLAALADALRAAKQADEAAAVDGRIAKLEGQAYAEHVKQGVGFAVARAPARKGGGRAVLVELFTGAQCPPCVAADLAFDAVGQAYPATDVVLLQYHLHVPAPDPLSTADNEARFDYYAEAHPRAVRGTPAILFNGKAEAGGGGTKEEAEDKFKEYQEVLTKLLAQPAGATLTATATRKGDAVVIKAAVAELGKPGAKARLRLALVEDWARYKGRNGLAFHHRVVRALPAGAKGVAVGEKAFEHTARVDLAELRKTLTAYLDETYPEGPRPMRLADLRVVAFVQNDETAEVLQAVDVPVREE